MSLLYSYSSPPSSLKRTKGRKAIHLSSSIISQQQNNNNLIIFNKKQKQKKQKQKKNNNTVDQVINKFKKINHVQLLLYYPSHRTKKKKQTIRIIRNKFKYVVCKKKCSSECPIYLHRIVLFPVSTVHFRGKCFYCVNVSLLPPRPPPRWSFGGLAQVRW